MLDQLLNIGGFLSGVAGDIMGSKDARRNRQMAQHQFNEQMDHSVRRRVEDAKRAGIHPLFALGASAGASPTLSAGGGRSGTSGTQNALEAISQRLGLTEANEARAARDHAEAAYLDAQRAKLTQDANAHNDVDTVRTFPYPVAEKPAYMKPEVYTSQPGTNRSTETGVHPRWKQYRRSDGSIGLAFSDAVSGSEELNMIWIPLQDWWHTSKQARKELRRRLGITTSDLDYLQAHPERARRFVRENMHIIREMRNFNRAISGRPIR